MKASPLFTWRTAIAGSELPASDRLVAFVLSLHMSELGDSAWPSQATIARKSGLARRTVQRALDRLEAEGWLVRSSRGSGRVVSHYTATVPEPVENPPAEGRSGDASQTEEGRSGDAAGATPATGRGGLVTHNHGVTTTTTAVLPDAGASGEDSAPVENAGLIVKAYIDAHREAFGGADPTDKGRLAKIAAGALAGGWSFGILLTAAKRAGADRFGAASLEKHARGIAAVVGGSNTPKGFAGIEAMLARREGRQA